MNVTRADEPVFAVTLTIRLHTTVAFARLGTGDAQLSGDDDVITKSDAIENAIGRLPEDVFEGFGGEFDEDPAIDGEAELIL